MWTEDMRIRDAQNGDDGTNASRRIGTLRAIVGNSKNFRNADGLTKTVNLRYAAGCAGRPAARGQESAMKRFEVGARVVEPTYGLGSVIAVEDAYTRVQFDEHGVKKFLTNMSRLEPSNEPAPASIRGGKPRKKRVPKKEE
jgi:hypothetical protein